jgi:hypothetical protein
MLNQRRRCGLMQNWYRLRAGEQLVLTIAQGASSLCDDFNFKE